MAEVQILWNPSFRCCEKLSANWVLRFASEHLAFNVTLDFFTGFFLPPRQTAAGIEIYKQAIVRLQNALGVPLAIETGVNYLRPRRPPIYRKVR